MKETFLQLVPQDKLLPSKSSRHNYPLLVASNSSSILEPTLVKIMTPVKLSSKINIWRFSATHRLQTRNHYSKVSILKITNKRSSPSIRQNNRSTKRRKQYSNKKNYVKIRSKYFSKLTSKKLFKKTVKYSSCKPSKKNVAAAIKCGTSFSYLDLPGS